MVHLLNTTSPALIVLVLILALFAAAWFINLVFHVLVKYIFSRTKTKLDDRIAPILRNFLVYTSFVTGLYWILTNSPFLVNYYDVIEKGFYIIVSVISGLSVVRVSNVLFAELGRRTAHNGGEKLHSAVPFMQNIANASAIILVGLFIMRVFEVDITPILASAGVVGVALAFAAKDLVANLFGGLSVFFDRPYLVGDYVIIDQQYRGEVVEIGMRSTKIRTRDNVQLTVPNSVMVTSTVINETGYEPQLRLRIPIQISYNSDMDKTEKVLVAIADKHKEIVQDPEPRVRYRAYGESGFDLELLVVIKNPGDKGRITHELLKIIHDEFVKHKIEIPYPQRTIHMKK